MSATNRGTKRKECDFYATPINVVENILNHKDLSDYGNKILEPSAGNGNISKTIKQYYPNKHLTSFELREEEYDSLIKISDDVIIDDYLKYEFKDTYDIIIGNPPYSLALDFCKKSLELLSDEGILIFLLRTAFLESKARYDFWQENPLSGLYTLSKRPSFTGKGTDATSYSWFVWDKKNNKQVIKVI